MIVGRSHLLVIDLDNTTVNVNCEDLRKSGMNRSPSPAFVNIFGCVKESTA